MAFVEQLIVNSDWWVEVVFYYVFQVNIINLLIAGLIIFHWVALQVSPQWTFDIGSFNIKEMTWQKRGIPQGKEMNML